MAFQATAHSKDGLLVAACKKADALWSMNDGIEYSHVQDFSNLSPPRVRLRQKDIAANIQVRCTFSSNTKPLGLVEYCKHVMCAKAGDTRFDEVSELMRRAGY